VKPVAIALNALRGFLIGVAEVIPGVSGGTIALIVGVYQRIIDSAAAFTKGMLQLRTLNFAGLKQEFKRIDLALLLPLGIGMLSAIVLAAAALEPLLENEPEIMRGLFFGMILVSLYVPFKMAAKSWATKDYVFALIAAVVAFGLMSLPRAAAFEPNLLVVFLGATVAICALVLPGVSGSFLLLALGLYAPTIAAVNDRNWIYLLVFVLGAIVGLGAFSTLLSWLLSNKRRITLVIMTGLMLGSLRAIWPWQEQQGGVLAPTSFEPIWSLVAGFVLVGGLILWQARLDRAAPQ
jgi:putative membrane protein